MPEQIEELDEELNVEVGSDFDPNSVNSVALQTQGEQFDVLEQLAAGEIYALNEEAQEHLSKVREVTDAAMDVDVSRLMNLEYHNTHQAIQRKQRTVAGKSMIIPRPTALMRVFSVAMVMLFAMVATGAAILVDSIDKLTGNVAGDVRFVQGLSEVIPDLIDVDLINEETFESWLERYPQHEGPIYRARWRQYYRDAAYPQAVLAYETAVRVAGAFMEVQDQLNYVRTKFALREFNEASALLAAIDTQLCSEDELNERRVLLGRLAMRN